MRIKPLFFIFIITLFVLSSCVPAPQATVVLPATSTQEQVQVTDDASATSVIEITTPAITVEKEVQKTSTLVVQETPVIVETTVSQPTGTISTIPASLTPSGEVLTATITVGAIASVPGTALPPIPQRVEFTTADGTELVGDYYPARVNPAPLVILMHQMGSYRQIWTEKSIVSWLNNRGAGGGAPELKPLELPVLPEDRSFGVLVFDFRGHGESAGKGDNQSAFLEDAQAAVVAANSLPGVDPGKMALMGASIGADAAVDACNEDCLGALSLSPGGYLGVPYAEAAQKLSDAGKPVYCLATQDDGTSRDACKSLEAANYTSIIYPGSSHGVALLIADQDPDVGQVLLDWLKATFGF